MPPNWSVKTQTAINSLSTCVFVPEWKDETTFSLSFFVYFSLIIEEVCILTYWNSVYMWADPIDFISCMLIEEMDRSGFQLGNGKAIKLKCFHIFCLISQWSSPCSSNYPLGPTPHLAIDATGIHLWFEKAMCDDLCMYRNEYYIYMYKARREAEELNENTIYFKKQSFHSCPTKSDSFEFKTGLILFGFVFGKIG